MCLTCGARARSIETRVVVRTRHERLVEVGHVGGVDRRCWIGRKLKRDVRSSVQGA